MQSEVGVGVWQRPWLLKRVGSRMSRCSIAFLVVALTACAGPEPIFKSTTHLQLHGKQQAEHEAAVCEVKAERAGLQHGTNRSGNAGAGAALGVIGGAAVGASAGLMGGPTGIAIGAAAGGAVGGILGLFAGTYKPLQPQQDYAAFVERCLKEKGYETDGWQ
ncbi:MAG: hypothetical protein GDA65_00165 [Nitrospira sp. CR1.1]|nr:hypothetical protein [Nitrospira sp. CR1.1]